MSENTTTCVTEPLLLQMYKKTTYIFILKLFCYLKFNKPFSEAIKFLIADNATRVYFDIPTSAQFFFYILQQTFHYSIIRILYAYLWMSFMSIYVKFYRCALVMRRKNKSTHFIISNCMFSYYISNH